MAETTKIEWLNGGHTASPWHGCAEVHAGCDHCYAKTMAKRNPKTLGVWGTDGTRVRSVSFADNCRRWNKAAEREGVRKSVFPSICDPFEDFAGPILNSKGEGLALGRDGVVAVPSVHLGLPDKAIEIYGRWLTIDDLRRDLFAVIDSCPHLDFILLTKRPENVRRMWPWRCGNCHYGVRSEEVGMGRCWQCGYELDSDFRPNVWLLTSISDQATADAMIPPLLACRDLVPVYGVSAEPLLGPIQFAKVPGFNLSGSAGQDLIRNFWVIVGGESGHGARPCNVAWIRSLADQCKAADVPCFVKQLGGNVRDKNAMSSGFKCFSGWDGETFQVNLKDGKGGDIDEWPADLRVREYPKARTT